jgi:lincosamide nucleotidyltransferase A/C/D/E
MTAASALDIYNYFEANSIVIWIDGGWAVDAALEKQTRIHGDIDIVIQEKDLPLMRRLLEARGYEDVPRDDTRPHNFVLGDNRGHQVDVHAIVLDKQGNGIYGPPENGDMWPAASLKGKGTIAGQKVRSITPDQLVEFHTGYEVDEDDYHDVRLLCEKFGIKIPADYAKFMQ